MSAGCAILAPVIIFLRACVFAGLSLAAVSCASGPRAGGDAAPLAITPATLYPLQVGYAWSYDVDSGDGQPVLATARVLRADAQTADVQSGQGVQHFTITPEGISRAGQAGFFLLHAPLTADSRWASGPEAEAQLVALGQQVTTPAGVFEGCVVIREQHTTGQDVSTTYCPGVGPVRIESRMQVRGQRVAVIATLRGYSAQAP